MKSLWLAIVLMLAGPALAHMHERPDLDDWLRTLYSNARGACCDNSEAETMAASDWRTIREMKPGECATEDGETGPLTPIYCVRLENPDAKGDWKWWAVPKAAVVELPNKAGPPLIWLIWNNRGSPLAKPYIRCFLPGTLI